MKLKVKVLETLTKFPDSCCHGYVTCIISSHSQQHDVVIFPMWDLVDFRYPVEDVVGVGSRGVCHLRSCYVRGHGNSRNRGGRQDLKQSFWSLRPYIVVEPRDERK